MNILRHAPRPRPAFALALCAMLAPAAVQAQVPDPARSFVQNEVVGSWNGKSIPTDAQPCGPAHGESFLVVVRDVANLPIAGATVQLHFAGSGIALSAAQNAGVVPSCAAHAVSYVADATGVAKFTPRFGGYNTFSSVQVTADGVVLATIPAISPDFDADGRISLLDFNTFATDYLGTAPSPRTDFDNCPGLKLNDLTWMTSQYFASQGTQLSPICP